MSVDQLQQNLARMAVTETSLDAPATSFVREEQGESSLFLVKVEPGARAYRYDVEVYRPDTMKSLMKASDDGQKSVTRLLCYGMVDLAMRSSLVLWTEGQGAYIYDGKATLYTSQMMSFTGPFHVAYDDLPPSSPIREHFPRAGVVVKIIPNARQDVIELTDLQQYVLRTSMLDEDRSLRTLLEMATSQIALNMHTYNAVGAGKLFRTDPDAFTPVPNSGICLRSGVAKGVKVVKNFGTPSLALVLDATNSPFFKAQRLDYTINELLADRRGNWNRIKFILRDVRVQVASMPSKTFRVSGFSDKPVGQLQARFQKDGPVQSIVDAYRQHGININPNFPAVKPDLPPPKGQKAPRVYAVEDLIVLPDQRVPIEKLDKPIEQMLLKENSVPPFVRMQKIMQHADRLKVFEAANNILRSFGIRVDKSSQKMAIRIRKLPQAQLGNQRRVDPCPNRATWDARNSRYLQTVDVEKAAVLCNFDPRDRRPDIPRFLQQFKEHAARKGLNIKSGKTFEFDGRWNECFQFLKKEGYSLVIYIDPSFVKDTHATLKLYEARYKLLTQHITAERVEDVIRGKMMTLENILNKTNCKCFGINYMPVIEPLACDYGLEKGNVFVIGYDVAHPPPMSASERRYLRSCNLDLNIKSLDPSIVGITANAARHPHTFVGDYFYQGSRQEAVDGDQLRERMKWFLEMRKKNRPEQPDPSIILVCRDGISEGQFNMAVSEELPALKDGCEAYRAGYNPRFIFVIGTKRHFKRFVARRDGKLENMRPGSVISDKFSRVDCPEFYMQAHNPIKGTSKAVQYAVPFNETNITQDQLQALLMSLCFSHQIVNGAVSLPEPVYQADALADRGNSNYKEMKRLFPDKITKMENGMVVDARKLTEMLGYKGSPLQATRFTA